MQLLSLSLSLYIYIYIYIYIYVCVCVCVLFLVGFAACQPYLGYIKVNFEIIVSIIQKCIFQSY